MIWTKEKVPAAGVLIEGRVDAYVVAVCSKMQQSKERLSPNEALSYNVPSVSNGEVAERLKAAVC